MKPNIHPPFREVTVTCACGAQFKTMSTASEIKVEVCSKCHPFFTGKRKYIDTAGRVDKFKRKYERTDKEDELTTIQEGSEQES